MEIKWPNNKKFAFTIVDDSDGGTINNIKPVYDYLHKHGLTTTKTAWVYPSRNHYTGQSLVEEDYLIFIRELLENGFEIGLHNVGSGDFNREEIIKGLEIFKDKLGFYPKMHINHSNNKDNIYWGQDRYQSMVKMIINMLYKDGRKFHGTNPDSQHFWGNICKEKIKYIRNHTFNGINTIKNDPHMPYIDRDKEKYSNYWFSSSDGNSVEAFNDLISKENIDKLEKENGACIVYTHFAYGFVNKDGELNNQFAEKISYLASREGWFVPASTLLDFMLKDKDDVYISKRDLNKLDKKWILDRVIKKIKS